LSRKVEVTQELIERAKSTFSDSKTRFTPLSKLDLTRAEIRALEKKNLVEKMRMFADRKFTNTTPSMYYVWRWKNGN